MDIMKEIEFLTAAYKKAASKTDFLKKMNKLLEEHQISQKSFDMMLEMIADDANKQPDAYEKILENQNEELKDKLSKAEEEIEKLKKAVKKAQRQTTTKAKEYNYDPCGRSVSRC